VGLWFIEIASGLHGGMTYNADRLNDETAARLHRGYLALVDAIIAAPDTPVGELIATARITRSTAPPPEPVRALARSRAAAKTAPATPTERMLAGIWCAQLRLPEVAAEDNFFDLGGHSLLAMQAILATEEKIGKRIDRNRYIYETLGQIARYYDAAVPQTPRKEGGLRRLVTGLFGSRKPG
jgi:acyl carrier protein